MPKALWFELTRTSGNKGLLLLASETALKNDRYLQSMFSLVESYVDTMIVSVPS